MSAPTWLTAAVETAFNRYLGLEPEALQKLAALQSKVIALQLKGLDFELYFLPGTDGVQVLGDYEGEPDTRLKGTALALARLGMRRGVDGGTFGADIEITGDTDIGQRFKEALDAVELDWEEWLSQATGDVLAHRVGSTVRGVSSYLKQACETLLQDTEEYLHEEARLMPTRIENDNFVDDVDRLRMDADRLEARVLRLETLRARSAQRRR